MTISFEIFLFADSIDLYWTTSTNYLYNNQPTFPEQNLKKLENQIQNDVQKFL